MSKEKKTAIFGPTRLGEQLAKESEKALKHYSLSQANFVRMCCSALVEIHHAGRDIELPISFVAGLTKEARKAVEQMGINLPTLRNELTRDILRLAANGEKIAVPGHIMSQREQGMFHPRGKHPFDILILDKKLRINPMSMRRKRKTNLSKT